jgi:hypothetical protein
VLSLITARSSPGAVDGDGHDRLGWTHGPGAECRPSGDRVLGPAAPIEAFGGVDDVLVSAQPAFSLRPIVMRARIRQTFAPRPSLRHGDVAMPAIFGSKRAWHPPACYAPRGLQFDHPDECPMSARTSGHDHGASAGTSVLPRTMSLHGNDRCCGGKSGAARRSRSILAPARAISRLGWRTVVRSKEGQEAMSTSS